MTTRARTTTRAPRRRVAVARVVVALALCAVARAATSAHATGVLVEDDGRSGARRADVEVRARNRETDTEDAMATTTSSEANDEDARTEEEGDEDEDAVETVDDEDAVETVDDEATTTKTTAKTTTTMPTVEDVNAEDADDSITEGAGAEEVRSADAAFESEAAPTRSVGAEKQPKPSAVARAGADEADEADGEEIEGGEGEAKEDEEEELSEEEALAIIEKEMKDRLKALYGEPTEKQKKWVSKVKEVHNLEGAASFTEDDTTCGSTGGLAVFTIWHHVHELARDAIATFVGAKAEESSSPHSLLSLRAKALKLVAAYDFEFKGTGKARNECIANYFTRQKVHEVVTVLERQKEEKHAYAHKTFDHTIHEDDTEDDSAEAIEMRERRIGRVAYELKKTIIGQLDAVEDEAGGGKDEADEQAGGTTLVLALNCRAQHQHRLVAAIMHAVRARFGLGVADFTLVVGKKAVNDELTTLIGESYDSLMSKRTDSSASTDAVKSRVAVCPDLPGIAFSEKEEQPERELTAMEKAMREAEDHVMREHQATGDPTNPQHMNAGGDLGMQALPGMPNIFDSKNAGHTSDGSARKEARAHFGLSDRQIGSHDTRHLGGGASAASRQPSRQPQTRQRTQGGFNALPKMNDPLDSYLNGPTGPSKYAKRQNE